ncbi:MAG: hypothetical protein KME12_17585 [Trichocoleus desertorum ATA4-8-CV12]|jgi:hypothetical protein|nr:hypothetical protein [Trichocoleus desertorum ATA4-8-CV12]
MSSASSGRYQSRLFNFFSRRSREFVDQCDRALRHAKVATVWGAQVLLYPFYAIFQTTRLVGRQIQTTIETGRPSLHTAQEPTSEPSSEPLSKADQVVHNVLQAVETLALPEGVAVPALAGSGSLAIAAPSEVTAASHPSFLSRFLKTTVAAQASTGVAAEKTSAIAIQGVATALETRTLVLVTVQNQILAILAPAQQQQLYQRIVWEVSHYQRYLHILARQRSQAPLQLPSDTPNLLPPIRFVRQIMAWVQTGPVAIALNWFQESRVAAQLSSNSASQVEELYFTSHSTLAVGILPIPPIPYEALAPLDRAIAQIEAYPSSLALTELSTALEQRGQSLVSLLRAAVDYFFGDRRLGLTGKANQPELTQIAGDHVASDRLLTGDYDWHPDPWLSYEDVFAQTGSAGSISGDRTSTSIPALSEPTVTSPTALPPALQVPISTAKNWWARLVGRFWQRDASAKTGAIVSTPETTADLATQQAQSSAIASSPSANANATRTTSLSKRSRSQSAVVNGGDPLVTANVAMSGANLAATSENYGDLSNTWIEAEATSLGYVKHPLERVLGWLDRAMLWLEEVIVSAGQWLQRLWGK